MYDNRIAHRKRLESLIQEKLAEHAKKTKENGAKGTNGTVNGADDTSGVKVREKRLLKQDEVYNGALEDILLGKRYNSTSS